MNNHLTLIFLSLTIANNNMGKICLFLEVFPFRSLLLNTYFMSIAAITYPEGKEFVSIFPKVTS